MYASYWIFAAIISFVSQTLGCPTLKAPRFGSVKCKSDDSGSKVCTFTCKPWTEMIGSSELTCQKGTNRWSDILPICYPDYTKCTPKHKERCPKITKVDMVSVKLHNLPKTRAELEALDYVTERLERSRQARSVLAMSQCFPAMCQIRCIELPKRKFVQRCVFCKRRKFIQCIRGGSLFGN